MSVSAAAKHLGVPIWTIRNLCWRGALPIVKLPDGKGGSQRRVWIAKKDLDELVERYRESDSI